MPNSAFLKYIVKNQVQPGEPLPSLSDISGELGVSVGKLREEVACAREAGIISLKPRVGMRREPFNFRNIVSQGIAFGMATGEVTFDDLRTMRTALEEAFWYEAVYQLDATDGAELYDLIHDAQLKLASGKIPHLEHRAFHLGIFRHVKNPLISGLLEVYWDVYASSEFNRYRPLDYWKQVWDYHERIIDAIGQQERDEALVLLKEHFSLLRNSLLVDEP